MELKTLTQNGQTYIDLIGAPFSVTRELEVNDLMALGYDTATNRYLLGADNLSQAFFDLKTGLAGAAMQKFVTYQTRVAVLLDPDTQQSERFQELMSEMNSHPNFRFFYHRDAAVTWLVR